MSLETIDVGTPLARRAIAAVTATGIHADDLALRPNRAFVSVATNVVRCSLDSVAPTAAVGHVLPTGFYMFHGEDVVNHLKFIDTAAGASAITYTVGRKN